MKHPNPCPKIGVIGAGPCGMATAKNLLQLGLTDFVVFEKNNQLGGNWIFDEGNTHASIYETTHMISSKRLSEFEDFPMPDDYPDYPSHQQVLSYFKAYAEHWGIIPFVRFGTEVIQVTQCASRGWRVTYQDSQGKHEDSFDYLLIANGHHWDPFIPSYPGKFTGKIRHSHDYKTAATFKDERVLVIGGGNSACDIAVETARVSAKTYISIRNGQHIFPKFIFGKPTDMAFDKIHWLPRWCKQVIASSIIRIFQGRYTKYHLKKPSTKPLDTHPTLNSELLYFIRHGKISPRESIERFEGHDVYFTGGRKETFDTIIWATGYKISFPFFDKSILDSNIQLYLKMIHPQFETLFFIGLFQPQGCIWPLADYQAKIAANLIKGTLKPRTDLALKINKETQESQHRYQSSPRHLLEVDYRPFRKALLQELKRSLV